MGEVERGVVMKLEVLIGSLSLVLVSCANAKQFDDTADTDGGKVDSPVNGMDSGGGQASAVEAPGPADTGPAPCVYPSGPYGFTAMSGSWVGVTVPPTFTWQGYIKGSSSVQTLSAQDLYDCDGRNGINAI